MRAIILGLSMLLAAPAFAADRSPAWQGTGADGKVITFDPAHLQRPAVLLFWATWCSYCRELMPHIQKVYDEAGRERLDVYAIDIKDDGDPVAELRERGQTFTLVKDGDAIADLYHVTGTPSLLVVDVHGDIAYRRIGGSSPEKIEGALRDQVGLKP